MEVVEDVAEDGVVVACVDAMELVVVEGDEGFVVACEAFPAGSVVALVVVVADEEVGDVRSCVVGCEVVEVFVIDAHEVEGSSLCGCAFHERGSVGA